MCVGSLSLQGTDSGGVRLPGFGDRPQAGDVRSPVPPGVGPRGHQDQPVRGPHGAPGVPGES